jgi:hypothetical protein
MVQQAAAIERVPLLVRDFRFSSEGRSMIRESFRGAEVADLRGQPDGVSLQVRPRRGSGRPHCDRERWQVRHGKVHAEQRRRPQDLTHRPGNEAKPARYGRRQGAWCRDRSSARPLPRR